MWFFCCVDKVNFLQSLTFMVFFCRTFYLVDTLTFFLNLIYIKMCGLMSLRLYKYHNFNIKFIYSNIKNPKKDNIIFEFLFDI